MSRVGVLLLGLLPCPAAHAAELSLAQPSACPIADELSFRAQRALGQPLATAGDLRCTIHVTRSAGAFAARLELTSAESAARQRFFRAPSCAALVDTLALAVVMAIGASSDEPALASPEGELRSNEGAAPSSAVSGEPARAEASTPDTLDAAAPSAKAAAGSVSTPLAQESGSLVDADATREAAASGVSDVPRAPAAALAARSARWRVHAGLAADSGTLPGVGVGALLGASLSWSAVELSSFGTYLPARHASAIAAGGSLVGADIALLAGSLLVCAPALLQRSELSLGGCAGMELGVLSGEGTDVTVSRSSERLWSAARADATARWGLGEHLALELLAGAVMPLSQDDFAIQDESGPVVVHSPAPVALRASVGIGVALD